MLSCAADSLGCAFPPVCRFQVEALHDHREGDTRRSRKRFPGGTDGVALTPCDGRLVLVANVSKPLVGRNGSRASGRCDHWWFPSSGMPMANLPITVVPSDLYTLRYPVPRIVSLL